MSLLLWTSLTTLAAAPVPQDHAPPVPSSQTAPVAEPATPVVPVIASPGLPVGDQPAPPPAAPPAAVLPDAASAARVQSVPPADGATHPGDIVVTARDRGKIDPLRGANETAFKATQAVDDAITRPIAMAYKKTAPKPFRSGVHNVLYNLREPVVFVNFLLQHKIGKAAETVGRFAINTTIGVAGLFDMAKRKPFRLPRRGNGFADTLGFYGVPNGPFLFLPLVGPTTVRDLFGGAVDRLILPVAFGKTVTKPEVVIPLAVLGVLDHRSEFDDTLRSLHEDVADPYANTRTFYLQRRQAEIDHLKGKDTGASSPMSEAPKVPVDDRGREVRPEGK